VGLSGWLVVSLMACRQDAFPVGAAVPQAGSGDTSPAADTANSDSDSGTGTDTDTVPSHPGTPERFRPTDDEVATRTYPVDGRTWYAIDQTIERVCSTPVIDVPQAASPPMPTGVAPDADGDGVAAPNDCDDGNAWVYPGADEVCDGFDNDCDPSTSEVGLVATSGYAGRSLADALQATSPGDVVSICGGTHEGPFVLEGVHLLGVGPDPAVLWVDGDEVLGVEQGDNTVSQVHIAVEPVDTSTYYFEYGPDPQPAIRVEAGSSLVLADMVVASTFPGQRLLSARDAGLRLASVEFSGDSVDLRSVGGCIEADDVHFNVTGHCEWSIQGPESSRNLLARVSAIDGSSMALLLTDGDFELEDISGGPISASFGGATARGSRVHLSSASLITSHVAVDATSELRGHSGSALLSLFYGSTWAGGQLIGAIDPGDVMPWLAIEGGELEILRYFPGESGRGRVFDVDILGAFESGHVLRMGASAVIDAQITPSVGQAAVYEDTTGNWLRRVRLPDGAPLGTTGGADTDGLWTLDCAMAGCEPPQPSEGVLVHWVPSDTPWLGPRFITRRLFATDHHVYHPGTGAFFYRSDLGDPFVEVPFSSAPPAWLVGIVGDEVTYVPSDDLDTVATAVFDGTQWVHEPALDWVTGPYTYAIRGGNVVVAYDSVTDRVSVAERTATGWTVVADNHYASGAVGLIVSDHAYVIDVLFDSPGVEQILPAAWDGATWASSGLFSVSAEQSTPSAPTAMDLVGDQLVWVDADVGEARRYQLAPQDPPALLQTYLGGVTAPDLWGLGLAVDEERLAFSVKTRGFPAPGLEHIEVFTDLEQVEPTARLSFPENWPGARLGQDRACAWSSDDLVCFLDHEPELLIFEPDPAEPAW